MFAWVITASVKHRWVVMAFTLLLAMIGIYAFQTLPLDAVPDVTNVQVQVLTPCPSLSTLDVERMVSAPIERVLTGMPDLHELRSISRQGVSVVTAVFDEGTDPYFARAQVTERMTRVREAVPRAIAVPEMGPMTTGLGEIFQFEVKGKGQSLMTLRTLLDWTIAPKLRLTKGVVEVNTFGGELKTFEVAMDAARMMAARISLEDVLTALQRNNLMVGGGIVQRGPEGVMLRGEGLVKTLSDIGLIAIAFRNRMPILVRDVAEVRFAPMPKMGAATRDGNGEVLVGMTMMLSGGNSREVAEAVRNGMIAINHQLPHGVHLEPFYDRTVLVNLTVHTVAKNLLEGALLVIVVLFMLLRNMQAGAVAALVIPLSMLGAVIGMKLSRVSGNLMSLGAIDFGLVVDAAIILLENALVGLSHRRQELGRMLTQEERDACVVKSALEVRSATALGEVLIAVVYIPVLALGGVEGRMFRPMAMTVLFALATAFVLSLTFVPATASIVLSRDLKETHTVWMNRLQDLYRNWLGRTMKHPLLILGAVVCGISLAGVGLLRSGTEFIPRLDEGTLVIEVNRPPSTSLQQSIEQATRMEKHLKQFAEVESVVTKTGRPEVANDPMGPDQSDVYVMLKPEARWAPQSKREVLLDRMSKSLREALPGSVFGFSQPIEMRMNELLSGVRSDFAIKVYGSELETLMRLGTRIAKIVQGTQGARDVRMDRLEGMPTLKFEVDRLGLAQRSTQAMRSLQAVEAVSGMDAGLVIEDERRFPLRLRWLPPLEGRWNAETVGRLPVGSEGGESLPLSDVVRIANTEEPNIIQREAMERRLIVQANVRGRDLGSFAQETLDGIAQKVALPEGYRIEVGGQFKNLQDAKERLMLAMPAALLLLILLLLWSFSDLKPAILILLNVPFAASGGVAALMLRGLPLSISAAIGFIAVMGVAVLNGLVLLSYIKDHKTENALIGVVDGAVRRLRPILTTALVASLGFLPMALSDGAGAEVQRPLATVVIGGLLTSTFLTLFVLPTFYYAWVGKHQRPTA